MSRHYGYKVWEVKRLTLRQLKIYLDNLPYVLEWSEHFNKPPKARITDNYLLDFSEKCGIFIPDEIKYQVNKGLGKPKAQKSPARD